VILNTDRTVMFMTVDDLAQVFRLDESPPRSSIQGLHYDHVAAVTALGEEPASGGVGADWRDDL
jgi:hypothetical protein